MQNHVLAALIFDRYVRYFGSLHPSFEMSCDTEYLERKILTFSETWSSSFCIVNNCLDDFCTNLRIFFGQFHRKKNTNFPKLRWERSKKVCLSSALIFSLVVTKKYVLRTSWGLSAWNNTFFLFNCRVTFRLRQFSKAKFGTLALYILGLRCLAIPNTYKNSFRFSFRKRGLRRFVLYAIVLMFFVRTFQKKWAISPHGKHQLSKTTLSTFQKSLFGLCSVWFYGCN